MDMGGDMMDEDGRQLVSPELQVLTPSYMIGYLNALTTLIQTGVSSSHCGTGFEPIGVDTFKYFRGDQFKICPKGFFKWAKRNNHVESLDALNVLLTGGRLTPTMKE